MYTKDIGASIFGHAGIFVRQLVCGRARSHILAGEMPAPEGWPATG